ncbi:hypothetical protein AQUCO_01000170v1 [Aquilegia coerulea]|uniref:Uncharacterized protein n=1 Tax=Aquilegia coerulea TaxID=218851 RepID=A0A2G5E964_AQUCA|nr:hypothetical protein AQUCO_01000170v1 [Aquilegia coerulea]
MSIKLLMNTLGIVSKGSAILFNTFDAFENEVLDGLKLLLPPIYTLGPLHLLAQQISSENNHNGPVKKIELNLWKKDAKCLQWLDSKEPSSVVYVNFGSIAVITSQQFIEFGWALANSKQNFLWIVRPDLVIGGLASLPLEFMQGTKERGLLASWCPQEEVLNHPSIGCFLSHSGWNSTLESVGSGKPMICWPYFADHQTISRYACVHWDIGMEIENVKRDEVEKVVRELMEGEKGKEMKKKVMEWKKKAEEATAPGGSSYINMNNLVSHVLNAKLPNYVTKNG